MTNFRKIAIGLMAFLFFFTASAKETIHSFLSLAGGKVGDGISFSSKVFAEVFYKIDEVVKLILPQAASVKEEVKVLTAEQKKEIGKKTGIDFNEENDKGFHFFIGLSTKKQVIGYVCKATVSGKWGPIEFAAGISPSGDITDVVVLSLTERRGRPVKDRRFLDQFAGKNISSPLKLKDDVRGIAGATISSREMTNGIKKVLHVFSEFYQSK